MLTAFQKSVPQYSQAASSGFRFISWRERKSWAVTNAYFLAQAGASRAGIASQYEARPLFTRVGQEARSDLILISHFDQQRHQ